MGEKVHNSVGSAVHLVQVQVLVRDMVQEELVEISSLKAARSRLLAATAVQASVLVRTQVAETSPSRAP